MNEKGWIEVVLGILSLAEVDLNVQIDGPICCSRNRGG